MQGKFQLKIDLKNFNPIFSHLPVHCKQTQGDCPLVIFPIPFVPKIIDPRRIVPKPFCPQVNCPNDILSQCHMSQKYPKIQRFVPNTKCPKHLLSQKPNVPTTFCPNVLCSPGFQSPLLFVSLSFDSIHILTSPATAILLTQRYVHPAFCSNDKIILGELSQNLSAHR